MKAGEKMRQEIWIEKPVPSNCVEIRLLLHVGKRRERTYWVGMHHYSATVSNGFSYTAEYHNITKEPGLVSESETEMS